MDQLVASDSGKLDVRKELADIVYIDDRKTGDSPGSASN